MVRYLALPLIIFSLLRLPLQAADLSAEERLRALEKAVEGLQQRNAELEREVSSLKKQKSSNTALGPEKRSKFELVTKYESFNPGQVANDNLSSITGGLNYYIHGDDIKIMANYIHTWSDFRESNPALGSDEFDELILRLQVVY